MLESLVIEQCAPTLAGMKTGNLFSYFFDSKADAMREFEDINTKLNARGVVAEPLLWKESRVLVYVYRRSRLENDLKEKQVVEILERYGYAVSQKNDGSYDNNELHSREKSNSICEKCLDKLKTRLESCEGFPHEIGVFLGYPVSDVIGFINHKGENCKASGLWKVYDNENETLKLFAKLQRCTRVYLKVFAEGRSITQMTVVA